MNFEPGKYTNTAEAKDLGATAEMNEEVYLPDFTGVKVNRLKWSLKGAFTINCKCKSFSPVM